MNTKKILTLPEMFRSRPRNGRSRPDDLFSASSLKPLSQYECTWFDARRPMDLPNLVVPIRGDLETLFADVATYYPDRAPLTAYSYVLEPEVAISVQERLSAHETQRERRSERQTNVWLGMIFGETLTGAYVAGVDEIEVSYSVCRRTLAFSLARYAELYGLENPTVVAANWRTLKTIAGVEPSEPLLQSIMYLSRSMASEHKLPQESGELSEFNVARFLFDRYSSTELAEALDQLYPGISSERKGLTEHFDARVPAFERVANRIIESQRGSEIDAIALAFFANLIAPGTLAHTRILGRRLAQFPSVLLWYSIFASLSEEFDGQHLFSGLGWKLLRDVEADFQLSRRPTADIALEEMKILARIGLRSKVVKPVHPRSLVVSIFPGIDVYIRFTDTQDTTEQDADGNERRFEQSAERELRVRRLLLDALRTLDEGLGGQQSGPWPFIRKTRKTRGAGQR
jgi:hypothetical protein